MGEDKASRSAGCSGTYSAPAACAARNRAIAWRAIPWCGAIADRGRPAVSRVCTSEEPGHGERGARWGCEDRPVVAVSASLQKPLVH
eukprot:2997035-Pleurochrysis_carterae.AAC.1